ncbi:MAG: HAMP domain-containing histidine kinase [Nitrococcus sp.]|nr:HAMP domain-containing histidine kinase [Nitrococcus sp.]
MIWEPSDWRALRILCSYRIAIAAILLAAFAAGHGSKFFPTVHPELFLEICLAYLILGLAIFALAYAQRPGFTLQLHSQILMDIFAIAGLIHASGGLQAGLGILMVIAVAGGSLLAGARMGGFYAAVASLILLFEQVLNQLSEDADHSGYTQVAVLGLATFATALAGSMLARRARENQVLAEQRSLDVANLEVLNNQIIQRLEIGVIALDPGDRIRLLNRTARELVGDVDVHRRRSLAEVSPKLAAACRHWRESWTGALDPLATRRGGQEFVPRFHALGPQGRSGVLIFLENLTQMRAQVQQAKLASIGRLTASIAHEIRNPLAAMMNAAQLLSEAQDLRTGKRLVEIIYQQGKRLNTTIESVLQLSRRTPSSRSIIHLGKWLPGFVADWREQQGPRLGAVSIEIEGAGVDVLFDADHLRQILDNLARNASEQAALESGDRRIVLRSSRDPGGHPFLEVADNGPGVTPGIREHLFEPFATNSTTGTGLGLYLARELCEANQARIHLNEEVTGGACFRITFAGPLEEDT